MPVATVMTTVTAMPMAMLVAMSMTMPTATSMTMAATEIEAALAGVAEKLVAKAGGNYKAVAERHR